MRGKEGGRAGLGIKGSPSRSGMGDLVVQANDLQARGSNTG